MFVGSYNQIKDFDIFAKNLGLFYNGSEKIGSIFGLTLSIIYILASLFIFIYYTISIIRKEELQVNDSTEYSEDVPYINLNNSDLFYFAFGVENAENASRFVDETIYRARAVYYYGKKNTSGGAFNTIEYRDLNIERCKVEKFGKEYQHLFTKGEFDDSYCVSNLDLALTGGFIYDKFSCIRILIYPCKNTSANHNHCKPQEEIDKVLAGGYFSILLKDIGLNPNNRSFPILPTIQDFYTTISKDFYKDVIFNYEITDIITDDGIISENKKTERYLKYDRIKESFYLRNDTEFYYQGKSICKIEIRLSDNIHVQRRIYKKFASALSTTGGYMQLIYTIFMLLSLIPNQFKLETIIVNGLLKLSALNKEANLSIKLHLNKDSRNSQVSNNMIIDNGKSKINGRFQNSNLNLNVSNLEEEKISKFSNNYIEQKDEPISILKLQKNNHINIIKDNPSLNKENDKEKENSLIDQSINNISKAEIYPKSTGFNIINPDKYSFNKSSNNKIFFNNNSNKNNNNFILSRTKTQDIKEINFNIFQYYCFRRCYDKKRKKINTFNNCILLYKEQMDIINIFQDFLKNRTNLYEKHSLKEQMKIFLKQTHIKNNEFV